MPARMVKRQPRWPQRSTSRCRRISLHPAMGALLASLNATHTGYELHVADALWAEKNETFLPDFLNLTKADYAAGFHPRRFQSRSRCRARDHQPVGRAANREQDHEPAGARFRHARTRALCSPTPSTSRATGTSRFTRYTEDEDFHLSATQIVKAPLMYRVRQLQLLRRRDLSGAGDALPDRGTLHDRLAAKRIRGPAGPGEIVHGRQLQEMAHSVAVSPTRLIQSCQNSK